MDERLQRLEEKIAYLERHVTEQDKAMLELADGLAALRRELKAWRERMGQNAGTDASGGDEPRDERPPHY